MPNKKSAIKELRKSIKRKAYNANIKHNIKDLKKKAEKAIQNKEKEAEKIVASTLKSIDKAVQKGVLKKNTGNRKKSRLQLKYNKNK